MVSLYFISNIIINMEKPLKVLNIIYLVLAGIVFVSMVFLLIYAIGSKNNSYLFYAIFFMVYVLIGTLLTIRSMKTGILVKKSIVLGIFMTWFGNLLGGFCYLVAAKLEEDEDKKKVPTIYRDDE